jgi:hypothetical protein
VGSRTGGDTATTVDSEVAFVHQAEAFEILGVLFSVFVLVACVARSRRYTSFDCGSTARSVGAVYGEKEIYILLLSVGDALTRLTGDALSCLTWNPLSLHWQRSA